MMRAAALMLMLVLQTGCSTRPRDFKPNIAVAPLNQDVQTRDFAVCKMMVDRGVKGDFSKQAAALAPGAIGATAGFGVAYAATVTAFSNATVSALTGGAAATSSTAGAATLSTALPIVGAVASVAVAAAVKSGNEKKVKSALGACMKEYGHDVTTWQLDRSKMPELPAELPRDPAKLDK
jgi:hypothetical protein